MLRSEALKLVVQVVYNMCTIDRLLCDAVELQFTPKDIVILLKYCLRLCTFDGQSSSSTNLHLPEVAAALRFSQYLRMQ